MRESPINELQESRRRSANERPEVVADGWWLVAGGWWLVAGGWWLENKSAPRV
jgi:hypothetical protein